MLNSFFKTVGKFAVGGVSAAAVAALGPLDSYVTHKLEKFTAKVAVEIAAFMPSTEDIVQAILDAQAAEPTKGSVWSFYATLAEGCLAFVGNFLHAVVQHPLLVIGVSGAVYLCRSTLLPFFASLKASTAFLWKPFTSFAAWCATFFNPSSGASDPSDAPLIQNAQRITTDTTVTLQQVTNIVTEHIKNSEEKQGASLTKLTEMHQTHFDEAKRLLKGQVDTVEALVNKLGDEHKNMCDRANTCMDSISKTAQEFEKMGELDTAALANTQAMQTNGHNLQRATFTEIHDLNTIVLGPIFKRFPPELKKEILEEIKVASPDMARRHPELFDTTDPAIGTTTEAELDPMAGFSFDVASTSQATAELPSHLFAPEPVDEFEGLFLHYQNVERAAQNLLPDSNSEAHSMLEALDPTFLLDNPSPLWVVSGCVATVCVVYFTLSLLKRRKGAPKRK